MTTYIIEVDRLLAFGLILPSPPWAFPISGLAVWANCRNHVNVLGSPLMAASIASTASDENVCTTFYDVIFRRFFQDLSIYLKIIYFKIVI